MSFGFFPRQASSGEETYIAQALLLRRDIALGINVGSGEIMEGLVPQDLRFALRGVCPVLPFILGTPYGPARPLDIISCYLYMGDCQLIQGSMHPSIYQPMSSNWVTMC